MGSSHIPPAPAVLEDGSVIGNDGSGANIDRARGPRKHRRDVDSRNSSRSWTLMTRQAGIPANELRTLGLRDAEGVKNDTLPLIECCQFEVFPALNHPYGNIIGEINCPGCPRRR